MHVDNLYSRMWRCSDIKSYCLYVRVQHAVYCNKYSYGAVANFQMYLTENISMIHFDDFIFVALI